MGHFVSVFMGDITIIVCLLVMLFDFLITPLFWAHKTTVVVTGDRNALARVVYRIAKYGTLMSGSSSLF